MNKLNLDYVSGIESVLSHRPSKMLWLIPSIIGFFIIFVFLWLTFSEVDVIVPSQGKTIPNSRMILIQSKEINVIDKVYVKNGESVKKGEVLVDFKDNVELFDKETVSAKYEKLQSERIFLRRFVDYISLSEYESIPKNTKVNDEVIKNAKLKLYSNIKSYDTETKSLEIKVQKIDFERKMVVTDLSKKIKILPYTKYKLEQIRKLVRKGLESEITQNELEEKFISQKEDIQIKRAERDKLKAQLEIAKKELEQFKADTLKENLQRLFEVDNELKTLAPELKKSNYAFSQKSIKASEDGIIYNLKNTNSGQVVQSGEVIMELIPNNSPLEVETKVLNRDIGFISIGQKVKVKIDSFKFTKYGYIEGKVISIESSSILDEKLGEIYPVVVQLDTNQIKVNNRYIKLLPGMTCSVDIKIGKRKLIEYIISPMIRYKDEALREK